MELDRTLSAAEPQVDATGDQLAGDMSHLRTLWAGLQRTREVVRRAAAAYEDSLRLLLNLDGKNFE